MSSEVTTTPNKKRSKNNNVQEIISLNGDDNMIIQEFYWDDEKILTIIHEKMENKIKNRTLREETKILGHKIIFKEYYNRSSTVGDFEHDFVIDGFLECNNVKNPYSNYSAQYKEFVNQGDNSLINNQQLSIDTENF